MVASFKTHFNLYVNQVLFQVFVLICILNTKKTSARSKCKSSNRCCYNFPDSVINEVGKSATYKKRDYDVSEGLTEEEYREVELVLY